MPNDNWQNEVKIEEPKEPEQPEDSHIKAILATVTALITGILLAIMFGMCKK